MAIDLSGMFRNLGAATSALGESVKGEPLPADPNQRNAMQRAGVTNPMLQQFGMGLGGAFGADMRSNAAKANQVASASMDPSKSSAELFQMAQALMAANMPKQAAVVIKAAQDKLALEKDTTSRKQLADRLRSNGLEDQAEFVLSGGDTGEAIKSLREFEEKGVLATGSREGRIAIAKRNGATPEFLNEIRSKKYDNMSDADFLKVAEGQKGDIKFFAKAGTTEGEAYRVWNGKVFDIETSEWKDPRELGLVQAAYLTRALESETQFMDNLAREEFAEGWKKAKDSQSALVNDQASQLIFDSGINTGFGADFVNEMTKLGVALGVIDPNAPASQRAMATEAFMANQGLATAKEITNFGAGTGLSNADREYAARMVGGSIEMTPDAIQHIMLIRRKMNLLQVQKHNKNLMARLNIKTVEEAQNLPLDKRQAFNMFYKDTSQFGTVEEIDRMLQERYVPKTKKEQQTQPTAEDDLDAFFQGG